MHHFQPPASKAAACFRDFSPPMSSGRSRDLSPPQKPKGSRCVCVCFHLIRWQPGLQPGCWAQPFGCLHLELYIWSKWCRDRRVARDDYRHRIWCLAAAAPATGGNQTFPGAEPGLTSQLPSLSWLLPISYTWFPSLPVGSVNHPISFQ